MPERPPWEDYGAATQAASGGPWEDYGTAEPAGRPLLGGEGATMRAAEPEGFWSEQGRKLKEAIFGHPDRAEMEDAGVYMQPTPAKLAETALAGASAMQGGAAMAGAMRGAGAAAGALRAGGGRRVAGVLADVIENPRGLVTGPLRRIASGGAPAAEAAPAAAGAAGHAAEIQAKILALRKTGLSGAQITSSLRQLYGIKPSDGQRMVDLVLQAARP